MYSDNNGKSKESQLLSGEVPTPDKLDTSPSAILKILVSNCDLEDRDLLRIVGKYGYLTVAQAVQISKIGKSGIQRRFSRLYGDSSSQFIVEPPLLLRRKVRGVRGNIGKNSYEYYYAPYLNLELVEQAIAQGNFQVYNPLLQTSTDSLQQHSEHDNQQTQKHSAQTEQGSTETQLEPDVGRSDYSANTEFSDETDDVLDDLTAAPEELAKLVTVGEVLAMVDEATKTLKETLIERFAKILTEKEDKLNARIAELEQRYLPQTSRSHQEPTEEILRRSRLLMRQKLSSAPTSSTLSSQNGNSKV